MSTDNLPNDVQLSSIPNCLQDDPIERVWYEIDQLMQRVNASAGPGEPRVEVQGVEDCGVRGRCRVSLDVTFVPVDGDETGTLQRLFSNLARI